MPSDRSGGEKASGPLWSEPGTLLEHVAVAVLGIDEDGRICYWGPGAQDLFGHDAAAVLGKPAGVLFPDPPRGAPAASVGLAERGRTLGYWRGRLPTRHLDGEVFDCGFRVFPVAGAGDRSVVMALASRSDELDRVKTNLAFLDALFETCPIGLVLLDEELRYVHLNQALADMDGLPIQEHIGRRMEDIMITSDGGEYQRILRAVAADGQPVVSTLVGVRTPGHPDRDQVRSVSFFPLSRAVGSRPGVGGLLVDVTDREQAIMEATAGRQRLALLDRAAARIGTTLDVDVTARELVAAAVPDFSDASVVEVVEWMDEPEVFDPERPLLTRRIASGTILPPPATELVSGLENVTYPPGSAIHRMLLTGRPVSVLVNDEFMTRTVIHQARAQLLRDSGLACILIAPLIARGTVQGITMFGRSAARPAFTEEDLSLAGELASRAALCLDNARLYSRVHDIALTLQRALLPSALATSPYVEVAHRYLPGSHITEVGGDWYDVINISGGRVALVVGDVMGHGVPAAAAMGRLRITAKALARHDQEPNHLLAELDACAQEAGIELATCLYILYDPSTGRARIASAGHPPPLVRHPDGTVETISDVLGVPLGVGGQPFTTIEIDLPENAILALYTDGLIEAPGRDIEDGLAAVRAELHREPVQLEETADRMLSSLLPDLPHDDTVLVLARVRRTPRDEP
ncbi:MULTISPECIES: SpoIIE family protein phosphatase [unclassified Streptomyces]|uniref:SpoIIE family protein phosphatase n=1 Tax=unclassified Streptomyces TaxID=2593676 RepID=UPI002DDA9461|nr:SpoIIE family protein phosphatase [Streptomyces sp. NBC_01750]WSB04796.1 SpoIIE family protein phosphatase [Streptomyces sp. NBC_01794]WSD30925.1 SpoIIE family protein phosphatase [Streptomyces sp. NBC_01750]